MSDTDVNHRILLIDDEPDWLKFAAVVLRDDGYLVATAQSVSEAVRLQQESRFELALLDSHLVEHQPQSFQEVALAPKGKSPPIVIMFATELTTDKMRWGFKLGARDCVDKRYDRRSLLALVQEQFAEGKAPTIVEPRILVVEDDEDWGRLLLRYLSDEPYRLEAVSDYDMALSRLQEEHFDVVVLDLRLVDEDDEDFAGVALLRLLGERCPSTTVVVVSAYGTPDHIRNGFRAHGLSDYISKQHFDPQTYREAVREAVDTATSRSHRHVDPQSRGY
jgi:DNA-binding response OmpR family regulator